MDIDYEEIGSSSVNSFPVPQQPAIAPVKSIIDSYREYLNIIQQAFGNGEQFERNYQNISFICCKKPLNEYNNITYGMNKSLFELFNDSFYLPEAQLQSKVDEILTIHLTKLLNSAALTNHLVTLNENGTLTEVEPKNSFSSHSHAHNHSHRRYYEENSEDEDVDEEDDDDDIDTDDEETEEDRQFIDNNHSTPFYPPTYYSTRNPYYQNPYSSPSYNYIPPYNPFNQNYLQNGVQQRAFPRGPCKYGSNCYRKNAQHHLEFSHPQNMLSVNAYPSPQVYYNQVQQQSQSPNNSSLNRAGSMEGMVPRYN